MSKPSDDATERLPRPIAQALERQNRRFERVEQKVDRILDLVQKIDNRLSAAVDEFEEFDELDELDEFDDELDEPVDIDEITKELEKLPPEEFKQRFLQLIATMQAAAKDADDTDDADEKEEP